MKQALRDRMRETRLALSPELYTEKSRKIQQKLSALPLYQQAKRILFYVSNEEEVSTHELIQAALTEDKAVFTPRVKEQELEILPITAWEELQPGAFGILEPQAGAPATDLHFDLILVPGLAFSPQGERLGYGKGFYDRLLKRTQGLSMGLAFEEQVTSELPTESHDIPVDWLLTDQSLFHP